MIRLGILDTADLDLYEILALAQVADREGYAKFWLAEHHTGRASYADPLLMSALVAGTTERIVVGSAGNLLRYQAPLALCNTAVLLAHAFPDRITLGLAAGSAPADAALALGDGRPEVETQSAFESRALAVRDILAGTAAVQPTPRPIVRPVVWMLGSSGSRARLAGQLGLSYCLSLFHTEKAPPPSTLSTYRESFRGSLLQPRPCCSIAVAVVCAETDAEASRRARDHSNGLVKHCLSGSPRRLRAQLRRLAASYPVDEIVLLECSESFAQRSASLTLLGRACGLCAASEASREAPSAPAACERSES